MRQRLPDREGVACRRDVVHAHDAGAALHGGQRRRQRGRQAVAHRAAGEAAEDGLARQPDQQGPRQPAQPSQAGQQAPAVLVRLAEAEARVQDDALGRPLLVGLSRKASLGEMTGRPLDQRLVASVVAALLAIQAGASIVRVHDVAATRDAIAVWEDMQQEYE